MADCGGFRRLSPSKPSYWLDHANVLRAKAKGGVVPDRSRSRLREASGLHRLTA